MKTDSLFDLKGKTALVTGSSRGIGFALARGLAEAGARVILNGRREDALESAVMKLQEEGIVNVTGYAFDISDGNMVKENISAIERDEGPIDILINNAGTQSRAPFVEFSEEEWDRVMSVNLKGAFLVSREVSSFMVKRKKGKIINICSLLSEVGRETVSAYTASKGGLKMLTRVMAVELGKYNIQVNGIGPGYIETEMNRKLLDDKDFSRWIVARTPLSRWGKPEDLVGAALFLSSAASDFITGQILYVDGGILAGL